MFVLICVTLLFSVRRITAATGSSGWGKETCKDEFCVTFSEGELQAEAGLCVVIPCSFKTVAFFTPEQLVLYKCEPSIRSCADSDEIFHSNTNNNKGQHRVMERFSLLEPDVGLRNCSIFMNDLTESDSGSYQLRVNGLLKRTPATHQFSSKVKISVKGLTQKPTVGIPPLTEGQQTTLSCTAPGLCSGSDPEITWTWRGAGEKDSPITGSITAVKTENLTSVTRRRSSTLTFNVSAEHHGTNVTCKVSFTNNITAEETVTLNVTYMKKPLIIGNTAVKEGDALRLTCSADSFPPSRVTWTKRFFNENLQIKNVLHDVSGTATVLIPNVTAEYSGQYVCTAEQRINNVTAAAEVTVTFFPEISHQTPCECVSRNGTEEADILRDQHGPSAELPWMVVAVISLIVNIICMILLMFLWNTRKKVMPKQEDRTYMPLQKTDQSPEYDVIARPLN